MRALEVDGDTIRLDLRLTPSQTQQSPKGVAPGRSSLESVCVFSPSST